MAWEWGDIEAKGWKRAMTKEELIAFEDEIAQLFNDGKIRAPIHLNKGDEDELIKIFADIKPSDWCFATHRSHYIALLHGLAREWLKEEILQKRSIHINNAAHHFFSSAIVAGICPIAVGVAMALKRQRSSDKVYCFVGDMAAETGIFYESAKYAGRNGLPITFIVSDNGMSVNTPTQESWGLANLMLDNIVTYKTKRILPHSGTGIWLKF